MNKKRLAVFAALVAFVNISIFAQFITVKKDDKGWRLLDDRKEIEVKGIVWSYTPIGETHTYDLWSKSDEYIERMIDTDMPMLKAMGVNAIRCFSDIPPKWVEYIYTKYGIYTIVNNLLGRYGVTVNGTWYANTDYSDQYTRETLIAMAEETAEKYRAVNGVLMYMFGNESNYGLVWSGSEIENLPVGEQNTVKAGYLYSLLEEAMAACKDIDPFHPVGIVNGDTQYLELIKELCPSLDILGVNAYRGFRFYDSFYENVAEVLDKPLMFTEAGADAYNEITHQEDQYAQMAYLMSQWKEIYQQGYGKGRSQNVIGGFVFEWIDEWWKHYQNKDLELHNDTGTWSNSGYELDYRDGLNNMDEEWFGICAQSKLTDRGINKRIPRAAYYLLQDIWKLSLYKSTEADIDRTFASLDTAMYLANGNEKSIKEMINENKIVQIDTLDATVQVTTPVYVNRVLGALKKKEGLKDSFEYQNELGETNKTRVSAETNLGLTIAPLENLTGSVVVKAWTDAPRTNLGEEYPSYYKSVEGNSNAEPELKYVDFYSASVNYSGSLFDLNGYYHVGHASFENTGDIFNISKEAFDIIGYDTYGSKAPIAIEFVGKGLFEGLSVIGGPEIWGSAKPQIQANYFKWLPTASVYLPDFTIGLVYAEEFGAKSEVNFDPYGAFGAGRKASIYAEAVLDPWVTLKVGGLHAGNEKVDAVYTKANGKLAKVKMIDTLGGYAQLGTNMFQHMYIYGNAIYRGLVAETNPAAVRGSFFTADSGAGNRFEVQAGVDASYGDFVFKPVVRARVPLQGPKDRSLLQGSPFIVGLGNRQAIEVEAVLTYDPEGATWFHEWNGDDIEGAKFAFSLTGMYTLYAGKTDNIPYKSNTPVEKETPTGIKVTDKVWFDQGTALPEQKNLWQVGTRIVTNPIPNLRVIVTADGGYLGATTGAYIAAKTPEYIYFANAGLAARYNHWIGSTNWSFNAWGPEGWWRNFNMTFPLQFTFDLAYGFGDQPSFLDATNRIGLKVNGRKFGKYSDDPYGALPKGGVKNGSTFVEVTTYLNIGL